MTGWRMISWFAAAVVVALAASAAGSASPVYMNHAINSPLAGTWRPQRTDYQISEGSMERFDQLLDHFSPGGRAVTWSQRYAVNDTYWQTGGPVFLYLCGEAAMEFYMAEQQASVFSWASEMGAAVITLEHRYFGLSMPTPTTPVSSLKYLTIQQALADAAYFVDVYNATLGGESPWVVFGASYSSSMALWFNAQFPNLVVGTVAPSGPVFALSDFPGYLTHFATAVGPKCASAVASAVVEIEALLETVSGREKLSAAFNACEPIAANHTTFVKYLLANQMAGSLVFGENPPDFATVANCDLMVNTTDVVAAWGAIYSSAQSTCNNFDESIWIEGLRNTSMPSMLFGRSWAWMKCRQFGWFYTSANASSVFFDLDVETYYGWCGAIFDPSLSVPDTAAVNTEYGGWEYPGSNAVLTNGLLSPWMLVSLPYNTTARLDRNVLSYTYEAGHCAPLNAPTPEDPPSLVQTRAEIVAFLRRLLGL